MAFSETESKEECTEGNCKDWSMSETLLLRVRTETAPAPALRAPFLHTLFEAHAGRWRVVRGVEATVVEQRGAREHAIEQCLEREQDRLVSGAEIAPIPLHGVASPTR